ncbi:MAG: sigma-70 family RNA polymerase sigma factor [Myxococcales bacterium]|nr:sigma-70 family RNA polymerase sigma factor [Myxococcales bacterium]
MRGAVAPTALALPVEPTAPDLAQLVDAEQRALLRLAQRLVWDPEEARDLVQATFADAYEKLGSLREPRAAASWLRRCLLRRALNHLRRRRLWNAIAGLLGTAEEPKAESPEALDERARGLAAVTRRLRKLPPKQAAAFTLRYLEGLEVAKVAEAMGVGVGTARTHLRRALGSMRAALAPEGDSP